MVNSKRRSLLIAKRCFEIGEAQMMLYRIKLMIFVMSLVVHNTYVPVIESIFMYQDFLFVNKTSLFYFCHYHLRSLRDLIMYDRSPF